MPNLASVLKVEVSRLARKELRGAVDGLRQSVSAQRSQLAALNKRVAALEKAGKAGLQARARLTPDRSTSSSGEGGAADASGLRFRAAGMAANRRRLGLSAHQFGLLVGASAQAVYQWEQGKSKPRPRNLLAIAALRRVGKREVATRLAALTPSSR